MEFDASNRQSRRASCLDKKRQAILRRSEHHETLWNLWIIGAEFLLTDASTSREGFTTHTWLFASIAQAEWPAGGANRQKYIQHEPKNLHERKGGKRKKSC